MFLVRQASLNQFVSAWIRLCSEERFLEGAQSISARESDTNALESGFVSTFDITYMRNCKGGIA